ncbi:MAG TPA: host attachment protein [Halothiobacillus sp.]|nr:host attachment protein [Halothiobacillus sp.]
MKTWVVVADAARARFFRVEDNTGAHGGSEHAPSVAASAHGALMEIKDLSHPASRLYDRELVSDAPGISNVRGMSSRFGMQEIVLPKEEEAIRFAKEVADLLKHNLEEFDRLYLIAAPHFLGLLRLDLDKGVRAKIAAELNQDLSAHSTEEIRRHLPADLA